MAIFSNTGKMVVAVVLFSAVPALASVGSVSSIQNTVAATLAVVAQTSDDRPVSTSLISPGFRAPFRDPPGVRPFVPRERAGFFDRRFLPFPFGGFPFAPFPFFFDDDLFFFGFEDDDD